MGVIEGGIGLLGRAASPLMSLFFRGRRAADVELADLRKQLQELLDKINESSVEAQAAVRGSSNQPAVQEAGGKAIRLSTEVGQRFATLFEIHALLNNVPSTVIEARRRYREVVADEENVDILDPGLRALKCAEIETACAVFSSEISALSFSRWGVGLGAKSGKLKGRKHPD